MILWLPIFVLRLDKGSEGRFGKNAGLARRVMRLFVRQRVRLIFEQAPKEFLRNLPSALP